MKTLSESELRPSRLILIASAVAILLSLPGCVIGTGRQINPIPLTLEIQATGEAAKFTIPVYVAPFTAQNVIKGNDRQVLPRANEILEAGRTDELGPGVRRFIVTNEVTVFHRTKDKQQWNSWIKVDHANHLLVVADLPMIYGASEADRYQVVPLDKAQWKHLGREKRVRIEVSEKKVSPPQ
jgi:hypothetical protein